MGILPRYNTYNLILFIWNNINATSYGIATNQCPDNDTNCLNSYERQDFIYMESMLVICPFDIATLHRIVLMLRQGVS
jgi:hypothetical protein